MFALVEILTGLILGSVGFFQIPDNPVLGSCALLLSGLLLLTGIDGLGGRETQSDFENTIDAE